MWLIVAFDIPVESAENKKFYRDLRKLLVSGGFQFFQKSLAWRWCDSAVSAGRIQKKLCAIPEKQSCHIAMFQIPDSAFRRTMLFNDGALTVPPDPPTPWNIIS